MKRCLLPLSLALLPLVAAAATHGPTEAAPAMAASQAAPLAPVEVNARSDAGSNDVGGWGQASIHDTPAAVTVIGRQQLEDHHVQQLRGLAHENAALGEGYAPVGYVQNMTVRGYPLDFATGYRINNLNVTGQQYMAMEDVQRVDVLKGLAGLDAGIVAPGGIVDFVTKRPEDVRSITLGTDARGSRYGALDVGTWLTPNFGVRANLAWQDKHSYVRHANARRNFYSLAVDWRITPTTTLQLDGNYQAYAQRSVSGYQLLDGSQLPPHPDRGKLLGYEPWQQPTSVAATNLGARLHHAFGQRWSLKIALGHSRSVVQDNAAFAYGCYGSDACTGGPGTGVYFASNGDYAVWDYRSPDETYVDDQGRVRIAGRVGDGFVTQDLSFGVSAFHHTQAMPEEVFDYVGTANIGDYDPPYFAPSPNQPGPTSRRDDAWQRTGFALDRVHLGAHWQVLAGGRFVRLHDRTYAADGTPLRDTVLSRALPQTALLWQPTPALTTYVSYGKGLSLGKQAPYWTSNADETLAPRLSRQIELGAKYRWNDALVFDAAAYRIQQPWQFAQPDATAAGFTFVQRGQEVHTGLELSAHGEVSANFGIHASASYIRARAEHTGVPAFEDHQVANVPRLRTAVFVDYRLPFAPGLGIIGGWRYASPIAADATGSVRAAAWNVFDAGLRYRMDWGRHALTWRLYVTNVFNHFYWQYTGSDGNDSYLLPGAPRQARLSVKVDL